MCRDEKRKYKPLEMIFGGCLGPPIFLDILIGDGSQFRN